MLGLAVTDYLTDGADPYCWTCSPRVEIGDVLFVYFMAPRKAIHFVCRATSRPYVDPTVKIRSDREISKYQWLVDVTPPVEIEPIIFALVQAEMGGYLNLRGQAGKYVESAAANRLLDQAKVRYAPSKVIARQNLQHVVGRSGLPQHEAVSFREWRDVPSAAMRAERDVEQYVVEPLLRFCGIPKAPLESVRQLRTPSGIPDYVIKRNDTPLAVVEVKQRVAGPRRLVERRWRDLLDHRQLCRYTEYFGCNGLLIDCDQVFLFSAPRMQLLERFDRRSMTAAQVKTIRRFLLGSARHAR